MMASWVFSTRYHSSCGFRTFFLFLNASVMPAKSLELKHTIKLIKELTSEIDEIEDSIQQIMNELNLPILSIPGMGVNSAAVILAEIGDFSNFSSPDKILAYAGCSPSTYQSGKLTNCYAHMEKRGSRYLRYALYNATKYVCHWNPVFAKYPAKNVLKVSTIMLPCLMPQRNSCG